MSTTQLQLVYDNSSAANYKAWGGPSGISGVFDSAGITRTADTGQVDWSTNPAVPASGSYLYEIRQMASDPLQTGGTAYYLKVEYGNNSGNPRLRISLGTGTNGSGTLTGFVLGPTTISGGATSTGSGIVWECNFSWDNSRFAAMLWRNATDPDTMALFGWERTKNTDGTDSSDGVTLIMYNATIQRTLEFGVGISFISPSTWVFVNFGQFNSDTDASFNNKIPLSPIFPMAGKVMTPMTIVATALRLNIIEGAIFNATLLGASRTWLSTKASARDLWSGAKFGVVMRYE